MLNKVSKFGSLTGLLIIVNIAALCANYKYNSISRNSQAAWYATNVLNAVLYLTVILFIVGFSCPAWSYFETAYFSRYAGLWSCPADSSCSLYISGEPTTAQWFECIALTGNILACVAVVLFYNCLYQERYSDNSTLMSRVAGALSAIGGLSGIIGSIAYSVYVHDKTQDSLGWAFIVTIISSVIITMVGGSLIFLSIPAFKNLLFRKYDIILETT